ncbi:hypothetical protein M407DRAFT_186779 [Tulasnella calospora MUT 4182]|uniref:Uncharacterized protein n=1 Tax=Tulasnella calospora MUT 4182 TaxID=1051891 RepID=A0A0C3LI32_9AGAM|nr:hypothetical protein M407DRAFT_186779 [Tulasnella calospora MUT 4182]
MATTISIALPQNYSPPPPPYTSILSARRPRSLSLSAFRTNPAFMTWLSILILRVHQNALVARWLNSWQWLALPSTSSSASGSYETAWLRGWVAARQDYVMTCWEAVRYYILHPSATFQLPNLDKKKRKLSLPPPPSSATSTSSDSEAPDSEKLDTRSHEVTTSTATNNNTLSEKSLIESPESIVLDVDSPLVTTSPPTIEVRLPPRSTTSSSFEEAASAAVRNVEVEGDAGINNKHYDAEDVSTVGGDCSPVCDSGYASSAEVDEQDLTAEEPETSSSAPLTFIDSPVIRKHVRHITSVRPPGLLTSTALPAKIGLVLLVL